MTLCLSLFVVLTASANALARARFGLDYPLTQSRYHYPGLIYVASTYVAWLGILERDRIRTLLATAALAAGIAFWISSNQSQRPWLELYRDTARNSAIRWQIARADPEHPDPEHARRLLQRMTDLGAFHPPQFDLEERKAPAAEIARLADEPGTGRVRVEHCAIGSSYIAVSGYIEAGKKYAAVPLRLRLFDEALGRELFFIPEVESRPDVTAHARRSLSLDAGFSAVIARRMLQPGNYQVQMVVMEEDRPKVLRPQRSGCSRLSIGEDAR